jgi:arabinofuranan 3-O-arabinosyltransferase
VFTRLRTRSSDRWRSDPEPALVRELELSAPRSFAPEVTVRLDQRASDDLLARLLGISGGQASRRLTGVATAAGWAATDGDAGTAWITPFGQAVGSSLRVDDAGGQRQLRVTQPVGDYSTITEIRMRSGRDRWDLQVPAPDAGGTSLVELPEPLSPGPVTLTITAVEPRITLDRRYAEPVELPAAIAEVSVGERTLVPDRVDTGCRSDLLQIDGQPIPVRVFAQVDELLAGDAVPAVPCEEGDVDLDAGVHRLTTTGGAFTGLPVDRVVLASGNAAAATAPPPTVAVTSSDRLSRHLVVDNCPDGCWLVLGEGFQTSWSASTDAGDLGDPQLVDGGFNGWWIPPAEGPTAVTVRWTAQTPLDVALLLTLIAVLACIVLAVVDRRRDVLIAPAEPDFEFPGPRQAVRPLLVAGGAWIVAALLLVGPVWALLAAVGTAALVVVGRPRLVGIVTVGILVVIGAVMVWVVRDEHPFPGAGWPARFEWLHGWGLFAAVTLLVTMVAGTAESHRHA